MTVFKTMIEPKEATKKELNNWKEPRHAYVLFETKYVNCSRTDGDWKREVTTGLMALNVQHRPEVGQKLSDYIRKGYRIIHYGNFPKANSPSAETQKIVRLYTGPSGKNPWDELEAHVKSLMGLNAFWKDEKNELEEQVKQLQAQLSQQGKKNVKADSQPERV